MKINSTILASCLVLGFTSYANAAGTISGQLDVRITIGQGCSITHGGGIGTYNQFGTLDFGIQTNLSTAVDAKASGASGANTVGVICSPALPYTVAVDNGVNATGSQRQMRNQTTGLTNNYIAYNLYQDSARATAWVSGTPVSRTGTGTAQSLDFYGRVPVVTPAPAAGTYTDSVAVTVSW